MDWQPIGTAPKDGTIVDLWIIGGDATVDFYSPTAVKIKGQPARHGRSPNWRWEMRAPNPGGWYSPDGLTGYPISTAVRVTHWMPLPAPPNPPAS